MLYIQKQPIERVFRIELWHAIFQSIAELFHTMPAHFENVQKCDGTKVWASVHAMPFSENPLSKSTVFKICRQNCAVIVWTGGLSVTFFTVLKIYRHRVNAVWMYIFIFWWLSRNMSGSINAHSLHTQSVGSELEKLQNQNNELISLRKENENLKEIVFKLKVWCYVVFNF